MRQRMVGIEYVCEPRFNLQGSMGIDCSIDFLPVAKHMRVVDKSTFADTFGEAQHILADIAESGLDKSTPKHKSQVWTEWAIVCR